MFAEKEADERTILQTLDRLPIYSASKTKPHKIRFIVPSVEDSSYFCPAENAVYDWVNTLKRSSFQTALNASYFLTTTEDAHRLMFENYLKTVCISVFNQTVIIICDAKNKTAVKSILSCLPNFAASNTITGEKFEMVTQKVPVGLAQIRTFNLLEYLNVNASQRKYA